MSPIVIDSAVFIFRKGSRPSRNLRGFATTLDAQQKSGERTKKAVIDQFDDGFKFDAERGGFEPPVPFLRHSISSAAQSAALSPLRDSGTSAENTRLQRGRQRTLQGRNAAS